MRWPVNKEYYDQKELSMEKNKAVQLYEQRIQERDIIVGKYTCDTCTNCMHEHKQKQNRSCHRTRAYLQRQMLHANGKLFASLSQCIQSSGVGQTKTKASQLKALHKILIIITLAAVWIVTSFPPPVTVVVQTGKNQCATLKLERLAGLLESNRFISPAPGGRKLRAFRFIRDVAMWGKASCNTLLLLF